MYKLSHFVSPQITDQYTRAKESKKKINYHQSASLFVISIIQESLVHKWNRKGSFNTMLRLQHSGNGCGFNILLRCSLYGYRNSSLTAEMILNSLLL